MSKTKNWSKWRLGGFGFLLIAFCVAVATFGYAVVTVLGESESNPVEQGNAMEGEPRGTFPPVGSLTECFELVGLYESLANLQNEQIELLK